MRSYKITICLFTMLIVFGGLAAAPRIRSQDDDKNKNGVGQQRREFPVVDFTTATQAAESPRRKVKGRRYDLKPIQGDVERFVLKESYPEEQYELSPSHAPEKSALPVGESDAVVIGEVTAAAAYLSNDRTGVYSEFTLRVEEVLKNISSQTVLPGSPLTAERRGGAVRFPSGKVLRRGQLRETMPLVGRRYVLFLQSYDETESFSIVTGYELRDGHVYPLDGVNLIEGAVKLPQFALYEGIEAATFLNALRDALAHPAPVRQPKQEWGHDN